MRWEGEERLLVTKRVVWGLLVGRLIVGLEREIADASRCWASVPPL